MEMKLKTKDMVLIGLCAALMCVFSQISIPILTVPFTMQTFGVVLISMILGGKRGGVTLFIYALIGFVGVPIFSNFRGGPSVIMGPTGGYIIGWIPMAVIVGLSSMQKNKVLQWLGIYLGTGIGYVIGIIQLKVVLDLTWEKALAAGLYPFILKDIVLVAVAIVIGTILKNRLKGILETPI
jgi:biotin transport system substrate-specific component